MNLPIFSLRDKDILAGPVEAFSRSTARISPARKFSLGDFFRSSLVSLGTPCPLKKSTCCSNKASPPAKTFVGKIIRFILYKLMLKWGTKFDMSRALENFCGLVSEQ